MENICRSYSVVCGGQDKGTAVIEKEGIRFRVSAEIKECDIEGPFRLAAVCGGSIVPVGVMLPNGDGYSYYKIFTESALRDKGISEVSGFTIVGSMPEAKEEPPEPARNTSGISGWEKTDTPWLYIEEGEFRHVFSACREALVRNEEEICYLAVPLMKGEEFPVMPVFCLGEIQKIDGKLYLVFKISSGKLLF